VLDAVVWHAHQGMTLDQIVSQFPAIALAGVHAALAYYFDHIEEIQQAMRAERLEEASRSVSTVFIRTNTSQPTSRLASGGAAST
jgi:hypothetical protein